MIKESLEMIHLALYANFFKPSIMTFKLAFSTKSDRSGMSFKDASLNGACVSGILASTQSKVGV